jgi:hypothetical protein
MSRNHPKRVQVQRKRSPQETWEWIAALPPDIVYVGRSRWGQVNARYPWGNPYTVEKYGLEKALQLYEEYLELNPQLVERIKRELRGKDLCCWCKLRDSCHADILLKYANEL